MHRKSGQWWKTLAISSTCTEAERSEPIDGVKIPDCSASRQQLENAQESDHAARTLSFQWVAPKRNGPSELTSSKSRTVPLRGNRRLEHGKRLTRRATTTTTTPACSRRAGGPSLFEAGIPGGFVLLGPSVVEPSLVCVPGVCVRFLSLVACSLVAAPLFAHPGHAATPVHVHIDSMPVDIGAWVFVVLLGAAAVLQLRGAPKKRR
jgi:hypothetical protein